MSTLFHHPDSTIFSPAPAGMATLLRAVAKGHSILARQSGRRISSLRDTDQQWIYCETSGSSGSAKTIRRSPASWQASFDMNAKRFDLSARDSYVTLGPLGHSLTLYATLEALHLGADILGLGDISPRRQVAQIAGSTVLYATPAQLHLLLRSAKKLRAVYAMRHLFCGGGMLSAPLRAALQKFFPNAQITAFFGASETSFITITDDQTPQGSVGRAYPDVDLQVDEAGEIWVRSPYLFDGYAVGDASDTRWHDARLSIGEMGRLDAQGNLFLLGRKSRMVTVADHNVFPEQIEAVVSRIVEPCAAIAVPDAVRGHHIVCVVQSDDSLDVAALRKRCQTQLGPQSVPRSFVTIAKMPMLAAGKPDLKELGIWLKDRA